MRKSEVKCKHCGKTELLPNSRTKTYKYCSRLCMKKYFQKIKLIEGEKINK